MMKRIIALLLALILTVGLLPTVALATEGDTPVAGTSSDVKNGYYEGTTWKEGTLNQGTLPTGVESVSKTAKPTSNSNEYEVDVESRPEADRITGETRCRSNCAGTGSFRLHERMCGLQ